MIRITLMMTVKRGAIYSKYCMLLVSRRVPSLHTAAGARTAVCSSFLCCFSLAKVKLSRIESPFSPVLIFSLCINSSTGLKVPQEVAVFPPPPLPRPYLRIDLSIFREMQMISVSSCRQSAHNLWASKKHDSQCQTSLWIIDCVCRFSFFFFLKGTKTSTYFSVLVESVCSVDVLRGAYLHLL